jgi:hypothetical protein
MCISAPSGHSSKTYTDLLLTGSAKSQLSKTIIPQGEIGMLSKGKIKLAGLRLEQEEIRRRIQDAIDDQYKRFGRLAERAGLFEANVDDDTLEQALRDLAGRFRSDGAAALPAGHGAADVTTATGGREKGKGRHVTNGAEG